MSNGRKTAVLSVLAALLLSGQPVPAGEKPGQPGRFAIIVHPDNPLNNISMTQLQTIFMRQKRKWDDGRSVIVINFKPLSPERSGFDRLVLNMSPQEVSSFWIDQRIRGKGQPPRSLGSARLIQRIVARNTEAIGYLPLEKLSDKVKVLRVDGLAPGRNGYPLKTRKKK